MGTVIRLPFRETPPALPADGEAQVLILPVVRQEPPAKPTAGR
jgi:hypothetical protein